MTLTSKGISPGALVKAARRSKAQTQKEFALSVDSCQSLISKYEHGLVDPPGMLLIHCMNILSPNNTSPVTEDSLVQLIRERLSGAEHAIARTAIAALIAGIR